MTDDLSELLLELRCVTDRKKERHCVAIQVGSVIGFAVLEIARRFGVHGEALIVERGFGYIATLVGDSFFT
jgi:hypothetical protein